ncbi:MAG TPA: PKD domain-containing protein [Bacteroidia bacterium]
MKKSYAILVFVLVFLSFKIGLSQSNSHADHKHEADLEEILPFEKYFAIISEIENTNGISGDEKNYFFKYISNEVRALRKAAIELNKRHITDQKPVLDDFKTAVSSKALTFISNKALIIDQIDNPLTYSGYNFKASNPPHDEINTPGVPCTNEGFESGNFTAWTGSYEDQSVCVSSIFGLCLTYSANDPYSVNGLDIGTTNSTNKRHTLCTAGADPNVPVLQKVRPGGGTYSVRLNNQEYSDYSASRLIQTFRVTPGNENFTYYYAVVLEDGSGSGHTSAEQPYFNIRMYNQSGTSINCAAFNVNATSASSIGFQSYNGTGDLGLNTVYFYKDWSAVFVPLSAYVGQDVTIEFVVNDCTQAGHLGYAYVDADCQPFQLISQSPQICNGINNILTAPAGAASYTWTTAGGNIVSGANTNTATVDAAGSYSVTMTAFGSGCSYTIDTVLAGSPTSPNADFSSVNPCQGSASVFTDLSTGGVTSWNWDFGDGGTSTTQSPSHTYASAGTYTVTLQATNGCTDTYTAQVVIPAGSTADFTTVPVCDGVATNFTNTSVAPAGSTFDWIFGDTQTTSNTGGNVTHTYSGANTYNVTLNITAPGGCNGTVTHPVVVNANPVPAFSAGSVCQNVCSPFTNSTPASPAITTWSWDFTNDGTSDNATSVPCFTYPAAGTYTASLTATTGGGCTGTITNTVTVNPNPVASFTATTECVNDPTQFNNGASTIAAPDNIAFYNWTFGDAQNASGSNPAHTYATCGTYTANLVLLSNNNCTSTYTTTVTVKCRPTVTVPTSTVVCPAVAIPATNFSSNPTGATYTWTNSETGIGLGAGGSNDIAGFNTTNITSAAITGDITVTPTLAGCTGTPGTYQITVNPTPPAPTTTDVTYCLNDVTSALTATPAAGGSLLWWGTTPAPGGTSSATAPTPLSAPVSTTTYYVSQTVLGCEGPRAPLSVVVNTLPSIIDPPDTVICPGINVPLRNFTSTPAGATLNWTNSLASIGLGTSGSGPVPPFLSANGGSTALNSTVTVIPNIGTCVGLPITYIVTVDPKPVVATPANFEQCANQTAGSVSFSSTPIDPGTTYSWSHTSTSVGLTTGNPVAATTASTPTFTATNPNNVAISTVFTLTSTLNGCTSAPVNFTFTANPLPTPIFASSHTCEGEATHFTSSSSVGTGTIAYHEWDFNNDNAYELSPSNATPSHTFSADGTQNIHMNVVTDKGCKKDIVLPMYVYPKPLPTISVDDPNGCADHSVLLSGGVNSASIDHANSIVSWEWDIESNGTVDFTHDVPGNEQDALSYTYTNTSPLQSEFYQVTLTATTDDGCTGSFTTSPTFVEVYANPIADFTYSEEPEPDVQNPLVQFIDMSQGASNWIWQFNDPYSSIGANGSTFQNPVHYYENYEATSYDVTLIINNGQCWDTITKPVTIKPDWTFYIPNCFSPNSDGVNDGFRGTGVGIKDYSLTIFDRWGALIWSSGDLDEYWDGKVKDRIVQQDTYIWKVKFKDGKGSKHGMEGHVSVIR